MADERQLTPEQIAKKTLEDKFTQGVIGSNHAKKNPFLYGQLGVASADVAYTGAMNGEEAQKSRAEIYEQKKREGEQSGVFGEPSYPTNYDISLNIARGVQESMAILPLGLLEEVVSGVADGLEVSVPNGLKRVTYIQLMEKIKSGKDLSDHEKQAMRLFQLFQEAYDVGTAVKATKSNYFADMNEVGKKIAESY